MEYPFPGNVRELENIIERSVALETSNIILPENLVITGKLQETLSMDECDIGDEGINLNDALARFEKNMIDKAIKKANGSKAKAAELLHISADSLRYRIEKLGI